MHTILMLGAQGSGKGTQAERLAAKLAIPTVSVGHLFRGEIDRGSELGKEIETYTTKGDRVPSEIVNQLMADRLNQPDVRAGVILDGYPRTLEQQAVLDQILATHGQSVTEVVYLRLSDQESLQRLSGRWVCSNTACEENYHRTFNPPKHDPNKCDKCDSPLIQREDDKPDAIRHRLDLYHRDTQPLIDFYRQRGILHEIDGERPIAEVEAAISALFGVSQ